MSVAEPALQQQVEALYSDHHGWLQGWLRRRLGNTADAADLAQDTFIRLLIARPGEIAAPRPYLVTVASRLLANLYRRRSLEQAYLQALAGLPEAQTPSLERQALILEALQAVDQVLGLLPARARDAFLLVQLEGCTQEAVAAQLGVSVRTVQRYLERAYEECIVLAAELP